MGDQGKIAIIGGGPAGAIALDTFLNAGFTNIKLYERHRVLGGTWTLDEQLGFKASEDVPGINQPEDAIDPPVSIPLGAEAASELAPITVKRRNDGPRYDEGSLYPAVETNVSAELLQFPQKPFPQIHPPLTKERFGVEDAYRSHEVLRNYILEYFHGREKYIILNTTVERATQPEGPGTPWQLIFRRIVSAESEEWWSETFNFIYAASGRFNVPYIPPINGLRETSHKVPHGVILHTKTFRHPEEFTGKRVVLIGAAWSNADVAHLINKAGGQRPLHIALQNILDLLVPWFAQPWLEAHPRVVKVDTKDNIHLEVTFEDGTVLPSVDALLLGTGYRYSYPYLDEYTNKFGGVVDKGGRTTQNLYWSTWWKYDASLAFSSNISCSFFWRSLELRARSTAAIWKRDRATWPTVAESDSWETERRSKNLRDFNWWWPDYASLLRGLSQAGGLGDPGPLTEFEPIVVRSIGLKTNYFVAQAQEWLSSHPDTQDRYHRTLKFLEQHAYTS